MTEHAAGEPVSADYAGAGFLMGYAARLLWRELRRALNDFGLDDESYIVLVNVALAQERTGEGPLLSEFVDRFALDPAVVDAACGRLARLGLLEVFHDDRVGGAPRLVLLEKGRHLMPAVQTQTRWMLEEALSGLTYEEVDQLTVGLRAVIGNLGGSTG